MLYALKTVLMQKGRKKNSIKQENKELLESISLCMNGMTIASNDNSNRQTTTTTETTNVFSLQTVFISLV